jgi:hypothetical protein
MFNELRRAGFVEDRNLVISGGGWALHDGQFREMPAMTNTRKIL